MKLARIGANGAERPFIMDEQNQWRDLHAFVDDINPQILEPQALARLDALDIAPLPILTDSQPRFGSCITGLMKIIAIGLNYADHALETGARLPKEPIIFMKATSAISGANDPIELPRQSTQTDWEVELGVVIGKKAKYIHEEEALDYVAGYCVINDVSERDYQKNRSGQWVKGKSFDSFAPIGPWFVSKDEIADPHNLALKTWVNGVLEQDGHTSDLIFKVPFLIAYLSQFMTLYPGDIIATGTPAGVGVGKDPPQFLKKGDRVALEVEGLGRQDHLVI